MPQDTARTLKPWSPSVTSVLTEHVGPKNQEKQYPGLINPGETREKRSATERDKGMNPVGYSSKMMEEYILKIASTRHKTVIYISTYILFIYSLLNDSSRRSATWCRIVGWLASNDLRKTSQTCSSFRYHPVICLSDWGKPRWASVRMLNIVATNPPNVS